MQAAEDGLYWSMNSKGCYCTPVLALLFCFTFIKNSFAQEKITINGLDRVEESTITQYFENFKIDKNFKKNIEIIRKNLLETELFSAVKIFQKNKNIIVEIVENPIIYETKFIGNRNKNG